MSHKTAINLYISGYLESSSTVWLGDTSISYQLNSTAYIAKYTDPAFMIPYVYNPTDTNDIRIVLKDETGPVVAYPNPFRQRVNIECAVEVREAYLTDLVGHRERVQLTSTGPGRYTLDLAARPPATYLLTLVTDSGRHHSVQLMKQSDLFPEKK